MKTKSRGPISIANKATPFNVCRLIIALKV